MEATLTAGSAPSTSAYTRTSSLPPSDFPQSRVVASASQHGQTGPQSFPLDPALGGPDGPHNGAQDGTNMQHTTSASPARVPTMPLLRPIDQYLPQQLVQGGGPEMHHPMPMFRTCSDPGVTAVRRVPHSQFLYYHQISVPGSEAHSIGFSAPDAVLRCPPPLPRQRTAKACHQCRKRKTKCSGGQPCSRCSSRNLACEYDEKSSLRGPAKHRMQMRHGDYGDAPDANEMESSRPSSRVGHRFQPYPSDMPRFTPALPSIASPPHIRRSFSAPSNFMRPISNLPPIVREGQINPAYAQYLSAIEPQPQGMGALGMEMSSMVDRSASATLRHATWGVETGHVWGWNQNTGRSQPATISAQSHGTIDESPRAPQQVVWSADISDYSNSSVRPPAMSSASSTSSLTDALLERPRAPAASPAVSVATPLMSKEPNADDINAALTTAISHSLVAASQVSPRVRAFAMRPMQIEDVFSSSGRSGSLRPSTSQLAYSSSLGTMNFSDYFDLSPEGKRDREHDSPSASASKASLADTSVSVRATTGDSPANTSGSTALSFVSTPQSVRNASYSFEAPSPPPSLPMPPSFSSSDMLLAY